jgi:hypothetical protein
MGSAFISSSKASRYDRFPFAFDNNVELRENGVDILLLWERGVLRPDGAKLPNLSSLALGAVGSGMSETGVSLP